VNTVGFTKNPFFSEAPAGTLPPATSRAPSSFRPISMYFSTLCCWRADTTGAGLHARVNRVADADGPGFRGQLFDELVVAYCREPARLRSQKRAAPNPSGDTRMLCKWLSIASAATLVAASFPLPAHAQGEPLRLGFLTIKSGALAAGGKQFEKNTVHAIIGPLAAFEALFAGTREEFEARQPELQRHLGVS
jgi:hypothetical protein